MFSDTIGDPFNFIPQPCSRLMAIIRSTSSGKPAIPDPPGPRHVSLPSQPDAG